MVVGSHLPHPHPPRHLPPAQTTSFTVGQKWFSFHSRTLSLRGRVPRCFLTYWRGACFCGWCLMGCMLSASARVECTGKDLWLHIWINPTNWRRSSQASCLTPSNSSLVSANTQIILTVHIYSFFSYLNTWFLHQFTLEEFTNCTAYATLYIERKTLQESKIQQDIKYYHKI